jgi:hypothetical protein
MEQTMTNTFENLVKFHQNNILAFNENASYDENGNMNISYDQKHSEEENPSISTYKALIGAYQFFNKSLFNNLLPNCMITLQRKNGSYGYFGGDRFINEKSEILTSEISLNPKTCATRSFSETMSTLVHEMCHCWQFYFSEHENRIGTQRGYHDQEWATKMISIGLMPSDTGKEGGKKTGKKITHYIITGGAFDIACSHMLMEGYELIWREWIRSIPHRKTGEQGTQLKIETKKDTSKIRFTCPICNLNAWAKESARLACLGCGGTPMLNTN